MFSNRQSAGVTTSTVESLPRRAAERTAPTPTGATQRDEQARGEGATGEGGARAARQRQGDAGPRPSNRPQPVRKDIDTVELAPPSQELPDPGQVATGAAPDLEHPTGRRLPPI